MKACTNSERQGWMREDRDRQTNIKVKKILKTRREREKGEGGERKRDPYTERKMRQTDRHAK